MKVTNNKILKNAMKMMKEGKDQYRLNSIKRVDGGLKLINNHLS